MAYADQTMSGNKIVAIIIVGLVHLLVGYALVTGLAYSATKKIIERVTTVDIDEPGLYHVALGAPGWIDLFRDGKLLVPAGHRHGEQAVGFAKIVDFELAVGHYTLALSGMTAGEVNVRISR